MTFIQHIGSAYAAANGGGTVMSRLQVIDYNRVRPQNNQTNSALVRSTLIKSWASVGNSEGIRSTREIKLGELDQRTLGPCR
jgi:hypothetical protein